MAVSLKHSFTSPKADGIDSTVVQPSSWNAEHVLTAAAGKILGTAVGSTTVGELPLAFDATLQSMVIPSGITGDRPAAVVAGMMRYNTTTKKVEIYTNSMWISLAVNTTVSASSPANPVSGDFWFDTTNTLLKTYNGTTWVATLATPSDNSVTTAKIVDGNITYAKLATALQAMFTPTGVIAPFAGTTAPTGWELCYGQSLSTSTYATLYSVIGYTYGGSGSSFNLPDLRGRTLAGKDDMGGTAANRLTSAGSGIVGTTLGATGGAEGHTLTAAQIPDHTHSYGPQTGHYGMNGQTYPSNTFPPASSDSDRGSYTMTTTSSSAGGGSHPNVQPTTIVNYIIKA